jgi:transcriptional regulator of acetoin/glycerol metabolism
MKPAIQMRLAPSAKSGAGEGPKLTLGAQKRKTAQHPPALNNIVKTAIRIIAGSEPGEVARAARIIGVSEPTLYRWRRAGNLLEARGAEVLRVHELTALPVELLLRG